jgi:hypothetical protein
MPRKKSNPIPIAPASPPQSEALPTPTDFYQLALDDVRQRLITRALEAAGGDLREAAALYHTDPEAFIADARRLGLEPQPQRLSESEERNVDWGRNPDAEKELLDRGGETDWDDDSGGSEPASDAYLDH